MSDKKPLLFERINNLLETTEPKIWEKLHIWSATLNPAASHGNEMQQTFWVNQKWREMLLYFPDNFDVRMALVETDDHDKWMALFIEHVIPFLKEHV